MSKTVLLLVIVFHQNVLTSLLRKLIGALSIDVNAHKDLY